MIGPGASPSSDFMARRTSFCTRVSRSSSGRRIGHLLERGERDLEPRRASADGGYHRRFEDDVDTGSSVAHGVHVAIEYFVRVQRDLTYVGLELRLKSRRGWALPNQRRNVLEYVAANSQRRFRRA